MDRDTALACARLSLGDAEQARSWPARRAGAARRRRALRAGRVAGEMASASARGPSCSAAVRARGEAAASRARGASAAELELTARKERKRIETEWTERIRRVRRRVQTGALDLALQLVSLWFSDLAALPGAPTSWFATSTGCDELGEPISGGAARGAARAIELVEDTRRRFELNVSEELACEALAYRLEEVLRR